MPCHVAQVAAGSASARLLTSVAKIAMIAAIMASALPKQGDERAHPAELPLVEGTNEVFKPSNLRFHK